ncbi:MAG: hypothetical protein PUG40_06420 [Berryella intestinalis]|nr:hypothetical protein [Berryella intestinalis]
MSASEASSARSPRIPLLLAAALCLWGAGAAILESGRSDPRFASVLALAFFLMAVSLGSAALVSRRFVRKTDPDHLKNSLLFKNTEWL